MENFTDDKILEGLNDLGINLKNENFGLYDVRRGLDVELEHGSVNSVTNITNDALDPTLKITLAHLFERGDYYDMLEYVEGGTSYVWLRYIIITLILIIIALSFYMAYHITVVMPDMIARKIEIPI
jgi:hypothetical protein